MIRRGSYLIVIPRSFHSSDERAGFATSVRYERAVLPTVDEVVIVDDRATIEASRSVLGGSLAVSGFAATSLTIPTIKTLERRDRRDASGGGAVEFTRSFARYLFWHATIEVARSFDARFDRVTTEPETVVRATTGLVARFGKRPASSP